MILQQKKPLFRTPIAFFINGSILFYLLFSLRHSDLGNYGEGLQLIANMLILIPLTPVVMAVLAVLLWSIYQLPRLIPVKPSFPQPNPYPLYRAVSMQTYRNLDWPRFFWGLFYISLYFISSWQIAMIAANYGFQFSNYLMETFETNRGLVEFIIAIVSLVIIAGVTHWLVFRPYSEMLRASLKRPFDNIFLADSYDIGGLIDDFFEKSKQQNITADDVKYFCIGLEILIQQLRSSVVVQNYEANLKTAELVTSRFNIIHEALKFKDLQILIAKVNLSGNEAETIWHKLEENLVELESLIQD